jgi:hypothetical protein
MLLNQYKIMAVENNGCRLKEEPFRAKFNLFITFVAWNALVIILIYGSELLNCSIALAIKFISLDVQ